MAEQNFHQPTAAPAEHAVIGLTEAPPPRQGPAFDRLLAAEQRIEWLLQHQPPGLEPGAVPALRGLLAGIRMARHDPERSADALDALATQAEAALAPYAALGPT